MVREMSTGAAAIRGALRLCLLATVLATSLFARGPVRVSADRASVSVGTVREAAAAWFMPIKGQARHYRMYRIVATVSSPAGGEAPYVLLSSGRFTCTLSGSPGGTQGMLCGGVVADRRLPRDALRMTDPALSEATLEFKDRHGRLQTVVWKGRTSRDDIGVYLGEDRTDTYDAEGNEVTCSRAHSAGPFRNARATGKLESRFSPGLTDPWPYASYLQMGPVAQLATDQPGLCAVPLAPGTFTSAFRQTVRVPSAPSGRRT
jgi:hypothetical protein